MNVPQALELFINLYNHYTMSTPRKCIANAEGYDIPLYIEDYRFKLDSNENMIGPSPNVLKALQNITDKDVKIYPAYGEILNKLADYNKIKTSMLLPANGADEAISYIFDALVEPDDTILNITPSFPMPQIYAKALGCQYKQVPYAEKWTFPTDEFIKNIDETTKLIIITTPNNPTGEAISDQDLIKILKAAKNSYVLVDETYTTYAGNTFINLLSEYPNMIISRSMSKDFALAGLRFGYLIASEEIINHLKKIISPYSINSMAVIAACAALDDIEHLNYVISEVNQSKKLLTKALKPFVEKIYQSDANFILADFGEKAEFVYKKLLKSGIKTKYFGEKAPLENCLRISLPSVKDTEYIIQALQPRDLIILDMDGVLVDTSNSYRCAIQGVYEKFSCKKLTKEQIQHAKNKGGLNNDWDLTMYLLEQDGINLSFDEVVGAFQELYWGNCGDGFILNEKALLSKESIEKLAEKYDLAIFTGRPKPEAKFVLKNWGLENYFYPVITMDDVPRGMHKPNPWGVYEILRITNPNKVYYLGDTVDDMFAAKQAKVTGIGILPPQDKSEELQHALKSHGAGEVLATTEDIIRLLSVKTC